MEIGIRQMKVKNCPGYLFSEILIDNIKDFDSNLLEKKNHIRVFLVFVPITVYTSLQKVLIVKVLIELIMMKVIFICFLMM